MRLLVVEDDAEIAVGLRNALVRSGNRVDVTRDGLSALNAIREADYDCVLLDLGLPDFDGIELLRKIRAEGRATPVVVVTARDQAPERVRGLDVGADDYVLKPFDLDELEARLRAVARRAIASRGGDIVVRNLTLSLGRKAFFVGDEPIDLLPREYAVLECLVLRHGRVVAKRQLLEHIAGWNGSLSETAVELYVHRVRRKIERSGCSIRTLRGIGYLLEADESL